MNKHFSRASLFALVASASIFASAARADSSFVPEESSECPAEALANKTPMCTYLTKCCNGNTASRDKCCAAALKNGC
jgi:hypothetical protein